MLTHHGMTGSANPGPFRLVEVSGQPRRIADYHRVRRKAPRNQGVCRNHAVAAENQFALAAYDCCTVADPASLLDPNRASGCETLCLNRQVNVFVGMIMIHDERTGRNHDPTLQMDFILRRDHTLGVNDAVVVNDDLDLVVGFR